jgi:hypothetical protein
MANECMTTKIRQQFGWVLLDLKTEVELSPVSWADKVAYVGNET